MEQLAPTGTCESKLFVPFPIRCSVAQNLTLSNYPVTLMIRFLHRLVSIRSDASIQPGGLGPDEERYVLARAYVPEHIVSLMTLISKGMPFLVEDHLGYLKDNWLILVGYPLEEPFTPERCQKILDRVLETYGPEYLWFIGPEVPASLQGSCRARQTDEYLILDLEATRPSSSLRRVARKAAEQLAVESGHAFTREHQALVAEFKKRQSLPPMVEGLYDAMPDYLAHSASACLLNAWDGQGNLSAFYVVELAAEAFDTYILGCYSRRNYVPHASDLLFYHMLELARERGKRTINLGLGVNEGIRRFKQKWGGVPFLKYEFCEAHYGPPEALSLIDTFLEGKL
ncbi:MAG: hypothetical protein Kow0063_20170 [Anaerolineae bacterium]